ncbi:unnamed protein product, partial [marine sediment metagenome]
MAGPPLKHDRDLSAFRDHWGITSPDWAEAAQLEQGVRANVKIDDTSHLVAPIDVPWGAFAVNEPPSAGLWSGADFTVHSPGGIWLANISAMAVGHIITTNMVGVIIFPTPITPDCLFGTGADLTTVCEIGSFPGINVGITLPAFSGFGGHFPVWLAYGSRFRVSQ